MSRSIPRFFEAETIVRRRPLCPSLSKQNAFSNNTSSIWQPDLNMLKHSTSFLEMNSSLPNELSSNCDTLVFRKTKGSNHLKETEENESPSTGFKEWCNLLNISNGNTRDVPSKYPMINAYSDECECEKYQYAPSEEFSCKCKETNATCLTYDLVPYLNVTAMRYNEYYISVRIPKLI